MPFALANHTFQASAGRYTYSGELLLVLLLQYWLCAFDAVGVDIQ
jgi:hypothetical protein